MSKHNRIAPSILPQHERDLWQERRIKDLWRIFRIMGEFVEGFETMSELGPCVSIFGSARTKPGDKYYEMAVQVAEELVHRGFGIITGGGPGIMEAGNRGANNAGGISVGLNIEIPHEQSPNPYIDHDKLVTFDFFFVRKVMFTKYAQGYVVLPGGFGTMDELFEALTLIQTDKSVRFPVILMGTEYWSGLFEWIKNTMLEAGNIAEKDLELFSISDDPAEAAQRLADFYKDHTMAPNF